MAAALTTRPGCTGICGHGGFLPIPKSFQCVHRVAHLDHLQSAMNLDLVSYSWNVGKDHALSQLKSVQDQTVPSGLGTRRTRLAYLVCCSLATPRWQAWGLLYFLIQACIWDLRMFFTNTQKQNCVSVGLWAFLGFTENLRRIFLVHSLVGEMGVGLSHKSGSGKKNLETDLVKKKNLESDNRINCLPTLWFRFPTWKRSLATPTFSASCGNCKRDAHFWQEHLSHSPLTAHSSYKPSSALHALCDTLIVWKHKDSPLV